MESLFKQGNKLLFFMEIIKVFFISFFLLFKLGICFFLKVY
jgi:hypothetical protein